MRKIFIVVLTLTTALSFGQTKDCDCSPNLNQNLKDKLTITHYKEFKDWLYQYFQKDETSRSSMKNNDKAKWSGKFSAVIESLPISGSSDADWAKSRENQKFYKIEQTSIQNKYLTEEQFDQVMEEKFGVNQLDAYKACLNLCGNLMGNGVTYVTGGDLNDEFFIQIIFNTTTGGTLMLKGPAIFSNLEPIGGSIFKDGLIIKDRQSVTQYFKRLKPEKAASFNINSNIVTNPIVFDATSPINQQAIPVGTIVASVLEYKSFLKANGLETIDNEKMDIALWIPCDGRKESKSKYSSYSGGNIPDLRGVFLRGINDYGVVFPGVVTVSNSQRNPENKSASEFQTDEFMSHTHEARMSRNYGSNTNSMAANNGGTGGDNVPNSGNGIINTTSMGGQETRPKNVTVYYYIKIN
jgi:hypothetical protein